MLRAMQRGSAPQSITHQVAERIEANLDALIDEMFAVMGRDPALAMYLAPELLSIGRAIARQDLLHEIGAIRDGWIVPAEPPPEVIETAQRTALLDAPVTIPLQAYRAGHRALWGAWRAEIEALHLTDTQRQALLDRGAEFFFDYADRCSGFVVEHYTSHRDELVRDREHRHFLAVRRLLDSETDTLQEHAHDLTRHHTAVIVIADQPAGALTPLARHFHAAPLTVSLDDGTRWAWFSTIKPPNRIEADTLAQLDPEATFGMGEPGEGVEGFRRTHRQARQALEIALHARLPYAHYREVALEALSSTDPARVRDFLDHELAPLERGTPTRAPLRETMHAYFQSGQNAAQTARKLGVHERTIAYRLNLIEERLGTPINSRRAELEVALRLQQLAPPG